MLQTRNRHALLRPIAAAASAVLIGAALSRAAAAQTADAPIPTGPQVAAAPVLIDGAKLMDLLVQNGVVTRQQADALLSQAVVSAPAAAPSQPSPVVVMAQSPDGVQTVPYIPETVRRQIKEELRAEVVEQAEARGWAQPGALPEWTRRFSLSGDVRVRAEGVFFDDENFPAFPDFQRINQDAFDVNGVVNAPFLNTTEDRRRARVRARLGVDAQIDSWIAAGLRIATGVDASPVSTNQDMGSGDLSKYQLWLDRAYVRLTPLEGLTVDVGRAENPFWTGDLLFDPDLNFDGVSARYRVGLSNSVQVFGTAGAFPVFTTSFDFGSNDIEKTQNRDKVLFASQLGARWRPRDDVDASLAVGYFDFSNIAAKRSSPCIAPTAFDSCDTDETRPQFQQFGNTLTPIRDIVPDPANPLGAELQYFGYASNFRVLDVRARAQVGVGERYALSAEADFVRNLAFAPDRILTLGAVNNLGSDGRFDGGDTGWAASVSFGTRELADFADWNVSLGYKYLESDAVVDAFTESDFHLGGTNAQGFILGGSFGLGRNTFVTTRWMSANEVSGPPFGVDLLQIDLNAEF